MASFNSIDFSTQLPSWPENCANQQIYFEMLKTALNNLALIANDAHPASIVLSQTTEPTTSQWQAEWVNQGNILPILPNAKLIWWNTTWGLLGGVYTIVEGSSVIQKFSHIAPKGGIHVYDEDYNVVSSTITDQYINEVNPSLHSFPTASITTLVPCDIHLLGHIGVSNAGADAAGIDFIVNGDYLAPTMFGLAGDQGVSMAYGDASLHLEVRLANKPPGTYNVQLVAGFHNTGSTILSGDNLNIGGDQGVKFVSAKAIGV